VRYEPNEERLIMDPVPLRREGESYHTALARLARAILGRALEKHAGNHQAAAADLEMPAEAFARELERLGLGPQ